MISRSVKSGWLLLPQDDTFGVANKCSGIVEYTYGG
jgi:hypothetical protein